MRAQSGMFGIQRRQKFTFQFEPTRYNVLRLRRSIKSPLVHFIFDSPENQFIVGQQIQLKKFAVEISYRIRTAACRRKSLRSRREQPE